MNDKMILNKLSSGDEGYSYEVFEKKEDNRIKVQL